MGCTIIQGPLSVWELFVVTGLLKTRSLEKKSICADVYAEYVAGVKSDI